MFFLFYIVFSLFIILITHCNTKKIHSFTTNNTSSILTHSHTKHTFTVPKSWSMTYNNTTHYTNIHHRISIQTSTKTITCKNDALCQIVKILVLIFNYNISHHVRRSLYLICIKLWNSLVSCTIVIILNSNYG